MFVPNETTMDEDEDVVWDGSPLHQHIQGLQAEELTTNGTAECAATLHLETRHQKGLNDPFIQNQ